MLPCYRNLIVEHTSKIYQANYSFFTYAACSTVVRVQLLSELEEIALGLPEETLKASWKHRLSLAQPNVEVWLRVLKGRSLIFPPTADEALWIKFAGMCRKNSRPQMAQRIMLKLLNNEDLQIGSGKLMV